MGALEAASSVRTYGSLRRGAEIARVRRAGRHAALESLVVWAMTAGPARPAVAVTVGKAVGNAVTRNRLRRRLKGALDTLGPLPPALRVVFVVRPQAAALPYAVLAGDVAAGLARVAQPQRRVSS